MNVKELSEEGQRKIRKRTAGLIIAAIRGGRPAAAQALGVKSL